MKGLEQPPTKTLFNRNTNISLYKKYITKKYYVLTKKYQASVKTIISLGVGLSKPTEVKKAH